MKWYLCFFSLMISALPGFSQKNSLNIKDIDDNMVQVDDSLYACSHETTNAVYTTFLTSLLRNEKLDEYQQAQIRPSGWADSLTYNPPYIEKYHKDKYYADYPVVNISHQGAQLFCDWLTEQYNNSSRGKFNKVRFRLPTEEEWTMAASAGNADAVYPWKDSSLQDKNGHYRANFNTGDGDTTGIAGQLNENGDLIRPAVSYQPNSLGLYNMAGNVAEMIDQKGVSKGGSWFDPDKALLIDSNGNYDNTSPLVGFRYFMDVLEK